MRYVFVLFLILPLYLLAQKPDRKDVKEIFVQAFHALKTNDSIAFKNLFLPDTNEYVCTDIKEFVHFSSTYPCFHELQQHLISIPEDRMGPDKIHIMKLWPDEKLGKKKRNNDISEYEITGEFTTGKDGYKSIIFTCAYFRKKLYLLTSCGTGWIEPKK